MKNNTNCTIGILEEDQSVSVIYCHWDGYLDANGERLWRFYYEESHIRDLLEGGDITSLGASHKVSVYYHKDFQEPLKVARVYDTSLEMVEAEGRRFNYLYCIRSGEWFFSMWSSNEWKNLKDANFKTSGPL
jgi:hypothetical protein